MEMGWEWEHDFPLWGSPYGYPYGDIHMEIHIWVPMGIPTEILWIWDGGGNGNSFPTATLVTGSRDGSLGHTMGHLVMGHACNGSDASRINDPWSTLIYNLSNSHKLPLYNLLLSYLFFHYLRSVSCKNEFSCFIQTPKLGNWDTLPNWGSQLRSRGAQVFGSAL